MELCVTSALTGQMEFWYKPEKFKRFNTIIQTCFSSLAIMETERQNKAFISESSTATSRNFMEVQTSTKTNDEKRLNPKTSLEITKLEDNLELVTFCHELDEYQKAFGESCINVQRDFSQSLMSRDVLLERLFQKAWLTFTVKLLL